MDTTKEVIDEAVSQLREKGFINYFGIFLDYRIKSQFIGLQRFGTTSIGTHKIGIALLQENYKEACSLILMPRKTGLLES